MAGGPPLVPTPGHVTLRPTAPSRIRPGLLLQSTGEQPPDQFGLGLSEGLVGLVSHHSLRPNAAALERVCCVLLRHATSSQERDKKGSKKKLPEPALARAAEKASAWRVPVCLLLRASSGGPVLAAHITCPH
ncbi:hypothetical protein V5799_016627 [Amblyomma americanum]|uniref:Uncharacterized protein n=1 Tax=Amblyomma americanum TaxID=6943 RepID=A0AAQ4F5A4_AMBAM